MTNEELLKLKDKFIDIVKNNVVREGIYELLNWMINATDFFTAPASTRFHEAYEGGLLEHSLRVYYELKRLIAAYNLQVSEETIAIIALFHDLCKCNSYKIDYRNQKNAEGKWESVPYYTFNEDIVFGGHGSKSLYLLQKYIKLSTEEAVAITNHMGVENGNFEVLSSYRAYPLAFLLHTADMASTIPLLKEKDLLEG